MLVVYVFVAWTLFVWTNRIRNIFDDGAGSGTSGGIDPVDLTAATVMVVLALLVAVTARRGRPAWALPALVVATVATWAVRVPLTLANPEWEVPFKVVHAGLAVVSIGLAWAAWRTRARAGGPVAETTASA